MDARDAIITHSIVEALNAPKEAAGIVLILDSCYECYYQLVTDKILSVQDITLEIDMSLRKYLYSLLVSAQDVTCVISADSKVHRLMQLSIEIGSALPQYATDKAFDGLNMFAHLQKIPFIFIDDLLSSLTISKTEIVWDFVEELILKLHKTSYFVKGQLLALKICNTVLKKLSKSLNNEFCGRILMLLSAIVPITDRSALNIGGEVNTSNISTFETEQEFKGNSLLYGSKAASEGVEIEQKAGEEGEEADEAFDERAPSYSLYKTFWSLQTHLCGPLSKPDATTGVCTLEAAALSGFLVQVSAILETLDRVKLPETSTSQLSAHADAETDAETYIGSKYLTSSQLFALQLRDPVLRMQLLTQILSYLRYLRSKCFEVKGVANKEATALVKTLEEVETRATAVLLKVPSKGAEVKLFLDELLHRESFWIKWKGLKPQPCPEFIRKPLPRDGEPVLTVGQALGKRSRSAGVQTVYFFDNSDSNVKACSKRLTAGVPSYEQHIEAYVDAEDPEAGIDEEYHPKHDSVYCWRARRLMAAKHMSVFEYMSDGDVGRGLKAIANGGVPPPEAPRVDTATAVMEEEEEVNGDGIQVEEGDHAAASAVDLPMEEE